jgi:hypothetical protein
MTALTRYRSREAHQESWRIYYGDVDVGWIGIRAGVPIDVDQWGWRCGFYPDVEPKGHQDGTARSFKAARRGFLPAWQALLPTLTEADFDSWRQQRAWTAWKYRMHDEHLKLPTERPDLRSRCFCGAAITHDGLLQHVYSSHMEDAE